MATDSVSTVRIEKLDTDNYGIWRQKMKALLLSKELWSVIDGDDSEDKKKSNQVMGLLLLHVSDFHLGLADEVATAKGLWDKLESTFKAKFMARRLLLRQQLNSLRKESTESITEYVARAKSIASELEAVGHKPEASELALPVLSGLPKEYGVLVTIISVAKEPPAIDDLLPMLLMTEQQVSQEEDPTAIKVYGAKTGERLCFYCKKPGHVKVNCKKRLAKIQKSNRVIAF